jgi:ankyrin repeat protein
MRDYWYADGLYDKRILDEILFEIYYFAQPENAKSRYEKLKHEEFRHKPLSKDDIDLMTAAFWGTPEDLAPILARGADINARSEYGYTPLMFASVWNHAPAVQFLLDRGACLDAENDRNETALDMAEKTHDRPVIGTLHKALLDLEGTDSLGDTPLMRILYSCHDQKLVQSFIDRGADVNAKNERGETALMIVAETTYDTGVARVLLDAGADANARDNQGMTALDTALNYGSEYDDDAIEFVEFLLSNGADPKLMALETPNRGGTDSLAESVLPEFGLKPCARFRGVFAENSAEEIASAVKNGLDLFCEDADREDFFEAALKYGSADVVRACLEQVSDVNKDWNAARIMKWMLRTAIEARGAEAVKALLEAGARAREEENLKWHERANVFPEGTDGSEEAREFKARLDAGEEILRLLREAGADVHEEKNVTYTGIGSSYSHNKYSLLYRPLGKNSEDADLRALVRAVSPGALKLLIREGAGVKTRGDGGCTALHAIALHFAEYFEPCAMLELLLDAGADVNARDKEGITPLMILADNLEKLPRVMNAVKILAEAGADFRARDSEKRSVYDRVERLSGSAAEKLMRRELMDAIKRAFGAKSRASVKKRADADMLLAAFCGTAAEIESALVRGANANAASKNGYTALMFASVFNATETAQCLIDNGADVDAKTRVNETALTLTALSERPDTQTIRALIAAGADVEAADGGGKTLLTKAMENSRYKAARVLMASGADVGCIIGGTGKPKKGKKYKENRHDAENREAEAMLRKFGLDV